MHPLLNLALCALSRANSALSCANTPLASAELLTAVSHLQRLHKQTAAAPHYRLGVHELLLAWHATTGTPEDRAITYGNAIQTAISGAATPMRTRIPLSCLDLPQLTYNALRRAGYAYIDELRGLTDAQLLHIRGIGPLGAQQISASLRRCVA